LQPNAILSVAVTINLAYWVIGQGLGGLFTGTATDPNTVPLFILLAVAIYSLTAPEEQRVEGHAGRHSARC
jgi:hypothetical protein